MKNLVSVKSYPVVVETWESKVTKTCHLLREALFRALTDSMYKNVHRGAHVSGSRDLEVEVWSIFWSLSGILEVKYDLV